MIGDTSRQRTAYQLYREWHGYYVVVTMNRDLFGQPITGGGYRPIRRLTYAEALTYRCKPDEARRLVAPERGIG